MIAETCPTCAKRAKLKRAEFKLVKRADGGVDRKIVAWLDTDGKHRYSPFCTLRCALDFARAAHKVGVRLKKK